MWILHRPVLCCSLTPTMYEGAGDAGSARITQGPHGTEPFVLRRLRDAHRAPVLLPGCDSAPHTPCFKCITIQAGRRVECAENPLFLISWGKNHARVCLSHLYPHHCFSPPRYVPIRHVYEPSSSRPPPASASRRSNPVSLGVPHFRHSCDVLGLARA